LNALNAQTDSATVPRENQRRLRLRPLNVINRLDQTLLATLTIIECIAHMDLVIFDNAAISVVQGKYTLSAAMEWVVEDIFNRLLALETRVMSTPLIKIIITVSSIAIVTHCFICL
jgi:hypothetical protein